MSRKSTKNVLVFLLAFIVSCVLWDMVIASSDSKISISLDEIDVITTGIDNVHKNGYAIYVEDNTKVGVTVTVSQEKGWLVNPSNIRLKADLSEAHLGIEDAVVYIRPEVIGNQNIIGSNYKLDRNTISVRTEKLISKEIPIEVQVKGNPQDGFEAGVAYADPATVTLRVPESLEHESITAQAEIDISDCKVDSQTEAPLKFYFKDGEAVDCDKLQIVPERKMVSVQVPIGIRKEVRIILPETSEMQVEDKRCISIQSSVESVSVLAKETARYAGNVIKIPVEDLMNPNTPDEYSTFIRLSEYLSPNVTLMDKNDNLLMVNVVCKKIVEKSFRLNASSTTYTGLGQGLSCEIPSKKVTVKLEILEEDNIKLNDDSLFLKVNLAGLEEGSHRLVPEVKVKSHLVDEKNIVVLSTDKVTAKLSSNEE